MENLNPVRNQRSSNGVNKILILISIIVVGLIVAGALIYVNQGKIEGLTTETLPTQQVAEKVINYINQNNMLSEGLIASLLDVVEENGVYKIHLKIGEEEYDSYATKDGKLLFPEGYDLTAQPKKQTQQESPVSQEIPKKEIPDVKLFVMSYCPFGLQASKMFLPVYELLKDKAEMGIYFVNYIMHEKKEIDENLRQYCIQKEEKEKYDIYLSCFVKDGDFEKCLSEANIDGAKLATCISETDNKYNIISQYNDKNTWLNGRYPKFDVHLDLNEKYGVRGSPTVVINDTVIVSDQTYCPQGEIKCSVVSDFTRSPENFKNIICQTFNSQPEECSQILSNDVSSPDFGLGTGSSSGGACE